VLVQIFHPKCFYFYWFTFGTTKLLSSDTWTWTSVAGSYGYMAPGTSSNQFKF